MKNIISIQGLSVSYDRKRVLTNIFLDIEKGKLYGVLGPNGAGKSTLFKAILGLLEPNAGKILIEGKEIEKVRKKIAYVPQRDDVDWQFPATVYDIVMMGRYPFKKVFERLNADDRRIADRALEDMGIVDLKKKQIGELSGGQQQRVFLARALCQQAEIFFLDEPFVGVDITTEKKIIGLLKKLSSKGKTVLLIHHDLSTVSLYFEKVILLNQRLIAAGNTKTVFTEKNISNTFSGQLSILHKVLQNI